MVAGGSFNVSVLATSIPAVSRQDSGGMSGFDIMLDYNSTILRAENAGFTAPQCPLSDNCIFDLPANDTFVAHQSIDSPAGITRLAVVSLGPNHRPDLSALQGQPAILFRVQFAVVGKGLTPIKIQQSTSQLLGFSGGCGSLLPFNSVDFSFDNRAPFTISALPPSGTVFAGQTLSVLVNVSIINSAGYGIVNLLLSNYIPPLYTSSLYNFDPSSGSLNATARGNSFTSHLTINTNPSAPPRTYILTIIGVINPMAPNHFQQNLNFSLTVTGPSSAISTTSHAYGQPTPSFAQIYLQSLPDPATPNLLASFTISDAPQVKSAVVFVAVAVWCSSSPYTLHWDFGDGSSGTGNPAHHSYSSIGAYTVTLSVSDSGGNSYSSTRQITVFGNTPQPSSLDPFVLSSIIALLLLSVAVLFYRRRRH
jgi:hypothetical protein